MVSLGSGGCASAPAWAIDQGTGRAGQDQGATVVLPGGAPALTPCSCPAPRRVVDRGRDDQERGGVFMTGLGQAQPAAVLEDRGGRPQKLATIGVSVQILGNG